MTATSQLLLVTLGLWFEKGEG